MRRNTQRRKSRKPKRSPAMAATKTPTQQDVVSDDLTYELWARTVKAILVEKGLWDVVENGIPPDPSKIPELAAATIQLEELSKDKEALQILRSSLPDSLRKTLETTSTTSAKHLWDLLKEANEEQSKSEKTKTKKLERNIISSSSSPFMDPRLESNRHLAITNMVLSLSDSYDLTTNELIIMGVKKLTFNRFRALLDFTEAYTVKLTLYEVLKKNEYRAQSRDCEGFIRWMTSMSDSYDGTALVMEQVMSVKNLTFETTRELLDVFESVPEKTISGIMNGFVVGSSSHVKEVGYSLSDLRCFLKEAKLEMKEGEGIISSASSQRKKDSATTRVMKSRHERGECIRCGRKGHVFKDCSSRNNRRRKNQSRDDVVGPVTFEKDMWMIYDTTTNHMTPHIKYFTTLDRRHRAQIEFITGESVTAEGMGDVRIMTKEGLKKTIKDVLFVPKIDRNVLSVSQLTDAGYIVAMTTDKCIIMEQKTGGLFGRCLWEERGYFLRLQVVEGNLTSTC
ncbi:PREDICTED: uncharacterized protein LOC104765987 [Camelina sativa]|uniref:Uncharacterized protein LOC104765987 n=1 Tax=Camelina sativa TaxID=90675 RepID=A0ABM1RDH8_CAMSA|nr:PREDICTED: uncharacterized protein LOC104765987 [Camelina sativa]